MKIRFCAALLLAALSITALTGCQTQAAPASQTPATRSASAPTEAALITQENAIAIALADAGFTEDQVTHLRTEFDRDDGQPQYEVDFHRDGFEYDYKIHAVTGKILSKDQDRDD